ncbi:hypothetical protein PF005_g8673 [Phytophthora fragariae]|uniref:Uncharacterized protein n=1 Tax=Phytophthora fragariae TaxID=53985 RepID=A0A6A3YHD4_9STRA|nr:hypothetical protein PF003_g26016 [Phytophthora fragariae]KAE9122573.1 hypothetical protein PF010_g6708 [Phytophthora fragariae]KAE9217409.1 hypothetical protein PF005_g8673 [Phytophthora fragariae]KAE9242894.1 hypothetical protein PF004_g6416 [Phytophthora fragariae]KAE9317794.1 hypothetical protein PF001_g6700 [Phytophthora fragariae]
MVALVSTLLSSTYSSTTVASLSLPETSASASMGASHHNEECLSLIVFLVLRSAKPTASSRVKPTPPNSINYI